MKHIVYLIAISSIMGCGNADIQTSSSNDGDERFEKEADPWLTEEQWNAGEAAWVFSLPHQAWSQDQQLIYEAVKSTADEFAPFLWDEEVPVMFPSQNASEEKLRDILKGHSFELSNGKPRTLALPHVTRRFKEEMASESLPPYPSDGEWELWFEASDGSSVFRFLDFIFHCESSSLRRISSFEINGNLAKATVEAREGRVTERDTLVAGKKYGIPEFHGSPCPSVRFDLVKEDGKWLIDHREILN